MEGIRWDSMVVCGGIGFGWRRLRDDVGFFKGLGGFGEFWDWRDICESAGCKNTLEAEADN